MPGRKSTPAAPTPAPPAESPTAALDLYLLVKALHILNGAVLFGTGLGIAFFMLRSHFTASLEEKHYAARNTVLADTLFTLPAVILQPVSGLWLVRQAGYDGTEPWLVATYGLYLLAGACWLPVVWIQLRLKAMLAESLRAGAALPASYRTLFFAWFLLGWPAFLGLVAIYWLMVAKPG